MDGVGGRGDLQGSPPRNVKEEKMYSGYKVLLKQWKTLQKEDWITRSANQQPVLNRQRMNISLLLLISNDLFSYENMTVHQTGLGAKQIHLMCYFGHACHMFTIPDLGHTLI
jgi:hypothetical protein